MVIDSKIEMPSRFYIATRFQLFSFVKDSEKNVLRPWLREKLSRRQQNELFKLMSNNEMEKRHLGTLRPCLITNHYFLL